jgi:hypothetical protein
MSQRVVVVLLVAAAAAAAVALNVILLGNASAGNDPVGRLSPKAKLPAAPSWIIRPTTGPSQDEGADD